MLEGLDDTGVVCTIERDPKHRKLWVVFWESGRAPERGFKYQSDAKAFVERLRHSHTIEWRIKQELK